MESGGHLKVTGYAQDFASLRLPLRFKPSLETTRTNLAWERQWYFAALAWGLPLWRFPLLLAKALSAAKAGPKWLR
jgi:hypothetical protein